MGAIKREPTPFGPVSDLFERLHDLHLAAGQPSLRQIATRIGRGVVSSSTVHNMFRGPRVPKWGFLELVVEELGGNVAEFHGLWQAARLAEEAADNPGMTAAGNGGLATVSPEPGTSVSSPLLAAPTGPAAPGTPHRIWSNENPQRNLHFTGRVAELEALRANLTRDDRPHPAAQLISGMGGVGKTEIATEYIHRHRDKYEIIWWIRAEHTDRVRDALVKLGQRLGVGPAGTESGRDRTIAASWKPWRLAVGRTGSSSTTTRLSRSNCSGIYPLARQVATSSLPRGSRTGPVTSKRTTLGFRLSPRTRPSASCAAGYRPSVSTGGSLRHEDEDDRRISEAGRLAEALGHLPIAIEHAAAYLTETGHSVDGYLSRFEENAHRLLNEQLGEFPASVSATWTMSTELLTPGRRSTCSTSARSSPRSRSPWSCA